MERSAYSSLCRPVGRLLQIMHCLHFLNIGVMPPFGFADGIEWRIVGWLPRKATVADAYGETEAIVHTLDDVAHLVCASDTECVADNGAKLLYAAGVVSNSLHAFVYPQVGLESHVETYF